MAKVETAVSVLNNYVSSQSYNKTTVFIGGKSMAALDIDKREVLLLGQELDASLDWEKSPRIASMIVRGAPRLLDSIRMVNSNTKNGFKGAGARGQELVIQSIKVSDLLKYNPSSSVLATYPMTTWLRTITSTGATQWSGTSNYNNVMTVDSQGYLAHLFLGFINPVEVPKLERIQLIKEGDAMVPEVLDFGIRESFSSFSTPIHELMQPWIIGPNQKYYIAAYYSIVGDDKTQPIGYTVKRASDVIAALA